MKNKRNNISSSIGGLIVLIVILIYFSIKNNVNYFNEIKVYLPMLIVLIILYILFTISEINKRKRYLNSGIYDIDNMSGIEFEEFLKYYFIENGYKVTETSKSHDFGADLILKRNNYTIVVQAKRYKGKVGIKAVQEVIGAISYYGANKGMVITNSFYTRSAIELARASNIVLWDRENLINELLKKKNILKN